MKHRMVPELQAGRTNVVRRELHYENRVVACYVRRPNSVYGLFQNAVSNWPDREALVFGDLRLNYRELEEKVSVLAAGLAAKGLNKGDCIAVMSGNCPEFIYILFAAAKLGAITVPISAREHRVGIQHILTDSGTRIIIADSALSSELPDLAEIESLEHRFFFGCNDQSRDSDLSQLETSGPQLVTQDVGEDDPAVLVYTSGTTGPPKGAILTSLAVVHSALEYQNAMDLSPDDRIVVVAPMNHVTGLSGGVFASVGVGSTLIILNAFRAGDFLHVAAKEAMTVTIMVPAMYNLCLLKCELSDFDLSTWRIGGYGGAPMPAATIEKLAASLPNLGLMNCYGATETASPVTFMPSAETASNRLSVGLPANTAQIAIMNESGKEVAPGKVGELWIAGPTVSPGYWQNSEATQREFTGGFWKSGDIGTVDEHGFIYLHDRKKDYINRGGYKIASAAIENVLMGFSGVAEAAVIAEPCDVLGERVHAVVYVTDPGLTEQYLIECCRDQMADSEVPGGITIAQEPLQRNANGKLLKRKLREDLFPVEPGMGGGL